MIFGIVANENRLQDGLWDKWQRADGGQAKAYIWGGILIGHQWEHSMTPPHTHFQA